LTVTGGGIVEWQCARTSWIRGRRGGLDLQNVKNEKYRKGLAGESERRRGGGREKGILSFGGILERKRKKTQKTKKAGLSVGKQGVL